MLFRSARGSASVTSEVIHGEVLLMRSSSATFVATITTVGDDNGGRDNFLTRNKLGLVGDVGPSLDEVAFL